MELKELCEQTLCIFEISDIKDLQSKLFECVKNNDVKKYSQFHSLVGDLSTDWLQKIFQYYTMRTEKRKCRTIRLKASPSL